MQPDRTSLAGDAAMTPAGNRASPSEPEAAIHLSGAAIMSAEKLLARLPATGGVIVLGSVSEAAEDGALARELALALQQISSKPALLVQAGARRAPESREAAAAPGRGLTDILSGRAGFDDLVPGVAKHDLACLAYGKQEVAAADLLISEAFREFLRAATKRFHWVLLHAPQLLDEPQVPSLIARSQGVVATLRRGQAQVSAVRALQELCAQLNRPLLGFMLT